MHHVTGGASEARSFTHVLHVLDSIFSSPRTSGMPRVLECFTTLFVRFDPIWPPHFVIASTVQGCWSVAPDFSTSASSQGSCFQGVLLMCDLGARRDHV